MAYNRRDRIGHWVRTDQKAGYKCTHACCRGYREHPEGTEVVTARRSLRGKSEDELAVRFRKLSYSDNPRDERESLRILHEWDRRAKAEEKARDRDRQAQMRREAIASNRAAVRQEREAEYERIKLDAEAHTQGYLTNKAGRAKGISDREILAGRRDVFNRYASDEAKDYFRTRPRPTATYFRGQDTRVHETAPTTRRKRPAVR